MKDLEKYRMTGWALRWYRFKEKVSLILMFGWFVFIVGMFLYSLGVVGYGVITGKKRPKKSNPYENCECIETETDYDGALNLTYCIRYICNGKIVEP